MSDDTASTTTSRRRSVSLGDAAREFGRHPTPWLLAGAVLAAYVWRATLGGLGLADLLVVLGYLAAFPFLEWVIHTSLLHWRPVRLGRVKLDPLVARKHREHHADPRDVELIFIPLPALVFAGALIAGIALLVPDRALGATFAATAVTLGLVYEWIHYLVHTDYRPKTAPYRAIWRHHRLHHFKNENYWFTVTTASTADRVLGTQPDPSEVPTSPTATTASAGLGETTNVG
jgi:sterol desaturase/sphingolipid hydroxylase (fatty acid hydroxylase superfamily)